MSTADGGDEDGIGNLAAVVPANGDNGTTKVTYPPPEAFEIPLEDENADSLIKKHPPKRLERLEAQPTTPPSIEDLEEKLATAEIRRQQFLASRAQKTVTQEKSDNDEDEEKVDEDKITEETEGDESKEGEQQETEKEKD
ncbi:uncharacterized protein LOC129741912 isoform X2 [Uranotaenia lowii]|uniref:uncharacterized protein LOC129741912 isoform X2 n=1 Tax=Uranotaenia lowii TaxID=190385 RepID=UPI00247A1486|nr:uncharacterized protein LOC129741912 isoform X2 [Uranotaenia lowii]